MPVAADQTRAAQVALAAKHHWYHSIELAPGLVTPGRVDLRKTAGKVLPDDLSGLRALDVGTFDGFWAFELERRGASVIATDLDSAEGVELPPPARDLVIDQTRKLDVDLGRGFQLASEALGSNVERRLCNIYDLSPDAVGGPVDLVFVGALLLHLRDPARGLERLKETLVPRGRLISLEHISVLYTLLAPRRPLARFEAASTYYTWWLPNLAARLALMRVAGFTEVRSLGLYKPPQRKPIKGWMHGLSARAPN